MKKLKNKWITKNSPDRLYHLPVPIVALTGGIATGKSTVAELFRAKGYPVIDADRLVKEIYKTPEAKTFVKTNFAEAFRNGEIDFKQLRIAVFGDPQKQDKVEKFIYSKLPEEFLKVFKGLNNPEFVIYDVPLLFEKKLDQKIDVTLCVYSPKALQLDRLIKRDNITAELAETILSKQLDIEIKKQSSDLIIENVADQDALKTSFENVLKELID